MKLYGIIGLQGSGKDTIADYLVLKKHFVKTSFAKKLKDIISILFGWNRDLVEGSTIESREWRNTEDSFWKISCRKALQTIGTDLFRKHFDDEIWIKSLSRDLDILELNDTKNVIVTDCRFKNEIDLIKKKNGKIIFIQRGKEPEWTDKVYTAVEDHTSEEYKYFKENNIHETDYNVYYLRKYADIVIYNMGTKEELFEKINTIF